MKAAYTEPDDPARERWRPQERAKDRAGRAAVGLRELGQDAQLAVSGYPSDLRSNRERNVR